MSAEEEGKGERKRRRGCRRERKGKTTRERRRRIDPKDTFRKVFRYLHDRDQHPVGVEFQRVQELREARDLGLREHGRDRAASGRGHDRRRCGSGGVSRRRRAATALAAPTQRRSIQRQHGRVGFRANRGTMRADWSREPRRGRGRGRNSQPADRPRRRRDNHPLCHRFDGPAGERGRPPTTMPESAIRMRFFPSRSWERTKRERGTRKSERETALLHFFTLVFPFQRPVVLLSTCYLFWFDPVVYNKPAPADADDHRRDRTTRRSDCLLLFEPVACLNLKPNHPIFTVRKDTLTRKDNNFEGITSSPSHVAAFGQGCCCEC